MPILQQRKHKQGFYKAQHNVLHMIVKSAPWVANQLESGFNQDHSRQAELLI